MSSASIPEGAVDVSVSISSSKLPTPPPHESPTHLSLAALRAYATTWFPTEFSTLPPSSTLHFSPHTFLPFAHTTTSFFSTVLPTRLFLGRAKHSPHTNYYAHIWPPPTPRVGIVSDRQPDMWPLSALWHVELVAPFSFCTMLRAGHASASVLQDNAELEGVLDAFPLTGNALPKFEWAVKCVAGRAPLGDWDGVEDLGVRNGVAMRRLCGGQCAEAVVPMYGDARNWSSQMLVPSSSSTPSSTQLVPASQTASNPPILPADPAAHFDFQKSAYESRIAALETQLTNARLANAALHQSLAAANSLREAAERKAAALEAFHRGVAEGFEKLEY
ncbi:hypothetical protein BDV95DRAFT_598958 [Massariosphaeria phaeospora]|uniref:Uncharacterized protein n=1 Tax=Massariosphaeria phaeospora TaxID=100035 RepID=A0A7C8HZJ4_9PLEO|nr:hypothetical protein BDV95DRAFT_598958 [Massariosphaeria phaeospora]